MVGVSSGCRVQASRLAVGGQRNCGKTAQALERMDALHADGVRLQTDIYPYIAGSANLSQLLPCWVHEGGTTAMVQRMRDPAQRDSIRAEWDSTLVQTLDEMLLCWVRSGGDASVVGKSVAEIARGRGTEPDGTVLDLIADEAGLVNMIAFGRSEDDLRDVLRHPATLPRFQDRPGVGRRRRRLAVRRAARDLPGAGAARLARRAARSAPSRVPTHEPLGHANAHQLTDQSVA